MPQASTSLSSAASARSTVTPVQRFNLSKQRTFDRLIESFQVNENSAGLIPACLACG
jgi:hypothetical protein